MFKLSANVITLLILSAAAKCQEDSFNNYLALAMREFPRWVRSYDMDPLGHTVNFFHDSEMMSFLGGIGRQLMTNYTYAIENSTLEFESSLQYRYIVIVLNDASFTAIGNYSIEGTVNTSPPVRISGNGLSQLGVQQFGAYVVEEFGVTSDGFIDLKDAQISYKPYIRTYSQNFEGLTTGRYEFEVITALKDLADTKMKATMTRDLTALITGYLTELFEKTPISEIIDTTMEPPASK